MKDGIAAGCDKVTAESLRICTPINATKNWKKYCQQVYNQGV